MFPNNQENGLPNVPAPVSTPSPTSASFPSPAQVFQPPVAGRPYTPGPPSGPPLLSPQPTPESKKRRPVLAAFVIFGIVVIIVGALIVLLLWLQSGITEKAERIVPIHAEPGTCWGEEEGVAEQLDCGGPHTFEVLLQFQYHQEAYPRSYSSAEICEDEFEIYVGIDYMDSNYDYVLARPSRSEWDSGVRQGLCVIHGLFGESTSGSAQGTRR